MNSVLPKNAVTVTRTNSSQSFVVSGVVDKKSGEDEFSIATSSGTVTVKVVTGALSVGDKVQLSVQGNDVSIEKLSAQNITSQLPLLNDGVHLSMSPDTVVLQKIAAMVSLQLSINVHDKDLLLQLQKIITTIARNPDRLSDETRQAIANLRALVNDYSANDDMVTITKQLADRIIALGEKLGQDLKRSGSVADVVLRAGTIVQEGFYKYNSVKDALLWLSGNKEYAENVPVQKIAKTFQDNPVVLKVYTSPIGDVRASFVSPSKVSVEIDHFVRTHLDAVMWRNIPTNVFEKVLSDRNDISFNRLGEIDKLAVSHTSKVNTIFTENDAAATDAIVPRTKGFDTKMRQWLTIALDPKIPLKDIVARMPVFGASTLPVLIQQLTSVRLVNQTNFSGNGYANGLHVNQQMLEIANNKSDVIPDLFRRIGLNLESSLLNDTLSDDTKIPPQSLKSVLLLCVKTIDSVIGQFDSLVNNHSHSAEKPVLPDVGKKGEPLLLPMVQRTVLDTAIRDIQTQIELLTKNIPDRLRPELHGLQKYIAHVISETNNALQKSADEQNLQTLRNSLVTFKQELDTILTRVESIQVLAKQVSVNDGQQQVICVPMKIDGQWSDVVVTFLKKDGQKQKGSDKKSVSIAIQVAPAMLGAIGIFMDYDSQKRFSMRMEFDNPQAKKWFEENKIAFSASLASTGLSVMSIDFKENADMPPSIIPANEKPGTNQNSGKIDYHA